MKLPGRLKLCAGPRLELGTFAFRGQVLYHLSYPSTTHAPSSLLYFRQYLVSYLPNFAEALLHTLQNLHS